jgi:hypothetical protein
MDPNEALQDIRATMAAYFNGDTDDFEHILDRVEALDEWLSKGGSLPYAWSENR